MLHAKRRIGGFRPGITPRHMPTQSSRTLSKKDIFALRRCEYPPSYLCRRIALCTTACTIVRRPKSPAAASATIASIAGWSIGVVGAPVA